jgi:hypothetical protein
MSTNRINNETYNFTIRTSTVLILWLSMLPDNYASNFTKIPRTVLVHNPSLVIIKAILVFAMKMAIGNFPCNFTIFPRTLHISSNVNCQ